MRIAPPPVERVTLETADTRVLAQAVVADADYPGAERSAMDGFAVAAEHTPGALRMCGEVRMGELPPPLEAGARAVRIATGGVLPAGADAVVPIEQARVDGTTVYVDRGVRPGAHVIDRDADMRCGEALLAAGTRIGPSHSGVLATLGITDVAVYRRPAVGVLSSGDELVEPSVRPRTGQVRDSNRYVISAWLRAMGAQPRLYPKLDDECGAFVRALTLALHECDAVVVSGGTSVGTRDALPAAVAQLGDPGIVVHGLRVKPGKPTLLGAVAGKPIVGLPGNPTSALMMLEAVGRPIVAALTGEDRRPLTVSARLDASLPGRKGWTWYVPVAVRHEGDGWLAHPLAMRSFSVSLTARADGYVVMDERDETWSAGTPVTVHRFAGTG